MLFILPLIQRFAMGMGYGYWSTFKFILQYKSEVTTDQMYQDVELSNV